MAVDLPVHWRITQQALQRLFLGKVAAHGLGLQAVHQSGLQAQLQVGLAGEGAQRSRQRLGRDVEETGRLITRRACAIGRQCQGGLENCAVDGSAQDGQCQRCG